MSLDPIIWQPYTIPTKDGRQVQAEIGILSVPESRDKANSRVIKLKMVRLPRKNATQVAPLVFLAGGPGDSAIHWAQYPQFLTGFEVISQVTDLILLDQRGCGMSEPNLTLPMPREIPENCLTDKDSMLSVLLCQGTAFRQRMTSEGIDLQAYNPIDSSDDLADLRTALGVDRINVLGYSYGSHLTLATIRRHPEIIDKAITCGFEGPDDTLKLPRNVQIQLQKLANLAFSQLGGFDLLATMGCVHDKLANEPVHIEIDIPKTDRRAKLAIGSFALQHIASTWMGVSNRFGKLPKLYASLDRGETAELAAAVSLYLRSWSKPATFYLTDGASSISQGRLEQTRKEAPECLLGDSVNFPFPEINEAYQPKDLGDGFRSRIESGTPILTITGSLDGNTPTEQAIDQLRSFTNSRHHLIRNAAHNDMMLPSDVHQALVEYLETGETSILKSELPEPRFAPIA